MAVYPDEEQDSIMLGPQTEIYDAESRPMQTLDAIFEKKMSKRLAAFHAKLLDRTQFDDALLRKQLDLEIINVTMVDDVNDWFTKEFRHTGQCTHRAYERTVTRETNEEGRFRRLGLELEQISKEYGVDYEKVIEMFE